MEKRVRGSGIHKARKKDKRILVGIIATTVLILGGITFAVIFFFSNRVQPNMEVVSMHEYRELNADTTHILLSGDILLEQETQTINGELYLPLSFVMSFAGPHLFWEPEINLVTLTNQTMLKRIPIDSFAVTLNFEASTIPHQIRQIGGEAFLPLGFVHEWFDINASYSEELNLAIVDITTTDMEQVTVMSEVSHVRHEPDILSPIVETVERDNLLFVFDTELIYNEETEEYEETARGYEYGFTRVRTSLGNIGFVDNNDISEIANINGFTRQPDRLPSMSTVGAPINMVWDLITVYAANYEPRTRVVHPGLNVISPTWIHFDRVNYDGRVIHHSSRDYVNWAHSNGIQVWPMVFDDMDLDVVGVILSDSSQRDFVIQQFMDIAREFNFDGYNIDLEHMRMHEVVYFLQFLRELSPFMRQNELTFSVAAFVPLPWNRIFNHREMARVADYVAIMAYDENVSSTGPNASLDFIRRSVGYSIELMPSEQVILGLPFYTRIWTETEIDGEIQYSVRSVGMQFARTLFAGHQFVWKDEYGSYYVEYNTTENGNPVTRRSWIEDARSIGVKTQFVVDYNLAGTAGWSRGLETRETWLTIQEILATQ